MVGLLDFAPRQEEVGGIAVVGVSAKGISYLLARFPELKAMLTGVAVTGEELMRMAPEAIAAIIACGCGFVPDERPETLEAQKKAEHKASDLTLEHQADLIEGILRVTMPGGVGPFVDRLTKAGELAGEGLSKVQGTKSPQQSLELQEPTS